LRFAVCRLDEACITFQLAKRRVALQRTT
jgi:hypothetical protein